MHKLLSLLPFLLLQHPLTHAQDQDANSPRTIYQISPPTSCIEPGGCSLVPCGSNTECLSGQQCGTWAGHSNYCCQALTDNDSVVLDCSGTESYLSGFDANSEGTQPKEVTTGSDTCPPGYGWTTSALKSSKNGYATECCPTDGDAVVIGAVGEPADAARCIKRIDQSSGSGGGGSSSVSVGVASSSTVAGSNGGTSSTGVPGSTSSVTGTASSASASPTKNSAWREAVGGWVGGLGAVVAMVVLLPV